MAGQDTFHLVIASVGETRFDAPALSATIPTTGGEITILAHHAPIVTTLKSGTITVRAPSHEPKTFDIENGILEVSGNRAVVLL